MDDADPARNFFPDHEAPPLYETLGVQDSATQDEIKKAYRKLALQHHPDKAGQSEEAITKFQQIGFAYAVLSDEKRRKRFDDTGRTDENWFEGEADWSAYFKELWQGEVNGQTLDDFVKNYKESDEERGDILAAYTESEGSLSALFENVMCSNVLDDEQRFIEIIQAAIKAKEVVSFPQWKKDVKDTKAREKRKVAAKKEAAEAEKLAKELGVHDKLFGNDKGGKKKSGKKGKVNEDGVDEDALKALIQSRNSKQNSMNSLIERLEAKYGNEEDDPSTAKGKKGSSKKRTSKVVEEPTEEEFEALQKKMFGNKNGGSENADDTPAPKKARKSKK